jgi:acyl-CoA thioester hydrolase
MSTTPRFPVTIELPLQWGEMDAFGHANNVAYLRWFESARIAYFERSAMFSRLPHEGLILARQTIDYRIPLHYPDRLLVSCAVTSVGKSSIAMALRVRSDKHQRAIAAEGEAVCVWFDYRSQKKAPVPDDIRASIEKLQQSAPEPGAQEPDA